jgi:hypothetical protein
LRVDSLIVKVVEKPVEVIRLRKDWIWWSGLIALMTLGIVIIIKTREGLKL